jgi:hypothetical protein
VSEPATRLQRARPKSCALFGDFECGDESMVFHHRRNKAPVSIALRMIRRGWRIDALIGDDFTTVATFALFGLAISLLTMGKGGLLDPEYFSNLLLLF